MSIYLSDGPSDIAQKYLKYGFVHMKPFEPGQRYRSRKGMESVFSNYRELRRDIRSASEDISDRRVREASVFYQYSPRCAYRSCTVGYTSSKGVGNMWNYEFYPHGGTFSFLGRSIEYNPRLPMVYRYYGKRRFEV